MRERAPAGVDIASEIKSRRDISRAVTDDQADREQAPRSEGRPASASRSLPAIVIGIPDTGRGRRLALWIGLPWSVSTIVERASR